MTPEPEESLPAPAPAPAMTGVAVWAMLGLCSGGGMALAAWLLIAPDVPSPTTIPFKDKLFHFVALGCLTGPAVLAAGRRILSFWLPHMLMLAAGIEVMQGLARLGRSASFIDFLAGALGIAAATWLALVIRGSVLPKGSGIRA